MRSGRSTWARPRSGNPGFRPDGDQGIPCRTDGLARAPSVGKILERRGGRTGRPKRLEPSPKPSVLPGWRLATNFDLRPSAIDKLGVTGSSPVPPTRKAPETGLSF